MIVRADRRYGVGVMVPDLPGVSGEWCLACGGGVQLTGLVDRDRVGGLEFPVAICDCCGKLRVLQHGLWLPLEPVGSAE